MTCSGAAFTGTSRSSSGRAPTGAPGTNRRESCQPRRGTARSLRGRGPKAAPTSQTSNPTSPPMHKCKLLCQFFPKVLPLPTAICSDPPKTISTVTANMLLLTLSFVPWSLSSCLIAENEKNRGRINKGRTDISIKKTKRIQKRR